MAKQNLEAKCRKTLEKISEMTEIIKDIEMKLDHIIRYGVKSRYSNKNSRKFYDHYHKNYL